mmetsp:Transcript_14289/g.53807  ORF Transcript_14289/g.53807 Transcript_14289/m.53807 type:complete len:513 (+) Transcript_14289:1538-3076(+)
MRGLLGEADLVEQDHHHRVACLAMVPASCVESLLDPGRRGERTALVAEHFHCRQALQHWVLGGITVQIALDQVHCQRLGGARLPDHEDRDAVQDGHENHEQVLAQGLVERDSLPQVHRAHELCLRLPKCAREDGRLGQVQPVAASDPAPALGSKHPLRADMLQLAPSLHESVDQHLPLLPGQPCVVAVRQRQDDRLADARIGWSLDVVELLDVPPLHVLAIREVLREPVIHLQAARHVPQRCACPLPTVETPHAFLASTNQLSKDGDKLFQWRHGPRTAGDLRGSRVLLLLKLFCELFVFVSRHAELLTEHGLDVKLLRLGGEGPEVVDVIYHGLRQRMDPVDEVRQGILDARADVLLVRSTAVFEDEPGHFLVAVQGLRRSLPVRIAGADDLQVSRKRLSLHREVAHNLLEESHAVARVHFVEHDDDVHFHATSEADLATHPGLDVGVLHPAMHVQHVQGVAKDAAHVPHEGALSAPGLAHDDHGELEANAVQDRDHLQQVVHRQDVAVFD